MMHRAISIAAALAVIAAAFSVTPALAWEVESGDCESRPVASMIGPAGDPWGRMVVKHTCKGWVRVPDEDWVAGATFHIAGKVLKAGDLVRLPPGTYEGTWSSTPEVEHVTIRDTGRPIVVVWRGAGKSGHFKNRYRVPNQCVLKTGWQYLQPESMTWVQDVTNKQRLATQRVAKAGWYGPLYKQYTRGLTCS
jgi:hypothetical protein